MHTDRERQRETCREKFLCTSPIPQRLLTCGWHYLSNMASFVLCAVYSVKDHQQINTIIYHC